MCLKLKLLDEIPSSLLWCIKVGRFSLSAALQEGFRLLKSHSTFYNDELSSLSLCFVMLSECVVGVCFQERSLSCVKQMVVGDPLLSIPVYVNICSSILVSESLQLFFWAEVCCCCFSLSYAMSTCTQLLSITDAFALPRREASSLWDLREDVLPVRQQERPHEKETRRGGAQRWKQRNRFVLSYAHCTRRLC